MGGAGMGAGAMNSLLAGAGNPMNAAGLAGATGGNPMAMASMAMLNPAMQALYQVGVRSLSLTDS